MSTAGYQQQDTPGRARQYAGSKVPVITGLFWVIKILTTGMGEATSDYLVRTYNAYLAVLAGAVCFAIAMVAQFLTKRYVTWIYWLAVVMVSVFGTMCADVAHIVLGVPYAVSTAAFVVILAVVFALWYRSEGTLSIHSIYTPRREMYYWATVLATFALGTAAGDMTARTLHLGFLSSGIMFAVVFAIPAIGNWKLGMNPILAFWFAYIVTRPFGASFADWMAIGHRYGGLGLGYGLISSVLTVLIVILVAVLAVTGKDVEERGTAGAAASQGRGGRHRSPAGPPEPPPAWAGAAPQGPPGYGSGYEYGVEGAGRPPESAEYWRPDEVGYNGADPRGPRRPWPGDGGDLGPGPGYAPRPGYAPGPSYQTGTRPGGPAVPPPDPGRRYGPADQTRRVGRPGPGQPPPVGPGPSRGPYPAPGEPRRYGPGDRTRPLDRRDPQRGPASSERAAGFGPDPLPPAWPQPAQPPSGQRPPGQPPSGQRPPGQSPSGQPPPGRRQPGQPPPARRGPAQPPFGQAQPGPPTGRPPDRPLGHSPSVGRPASDWGPASDGHPRSGGRPGSGGYSEPNGRSASNGHPASNGRSASNGYVASDSYFESDGNLANGQEPGGGTLRPDQWPPFRPDDEPSPESRWPDDDPAGW